MRRIRQAGASPKPGDEDAAPVELTSANWESVVGGGGLAVVSFWAPGAGSAAGSARSSAGCAGVTRASCSAR